MILRKPKSILAQENKYVLRVVEKSESALFNISPAAENTLSAGTKVAG